MVSRFPLLAILVPVLGCQDPVASDAGEARPPSQTPDQLTDLWTRSRGVDWPTFLGPAADSKSPETGLAVPWPATGPRIVWQREIGEGYGIGSVSRGRYFHFDRQREHARVTCLNAETGDLIWKHEYRTDYRDMLGYNNGPRCSPVVDGNRLYLFGVEGTLLCLRASDGNPIWSVDTSQKYGVVQNFFGVGSTPVIEGDLLICMIGGSPPGSPGLYESGGHVDGNGTGVVAFDKLTGKEVYRLSDELASYASLQLATIDQRRWCFAFARGGLIGFEPSTGKLDFRYPWRDRKLESVNASTPVVIGDEVFISETYGIGSSLLKVHPSGYDVVWQDQRTRRQKSLLAHWNTPICIDGYLYGCSGRNPPDADLRCIDWKTGEVMWTEQAPPASRGRSSLLYVDGHFIALGEYGSLKLIKVNPQRYELISQVVLQEPATTPGSRPRRLLSPPCWAAPILSHGLLFVRGDDRLVCLELIPES